MAKLVEMDKQASIFAHMNKEEVVKGSIILINKFSVTPEEIYQFLKGWATEAEKFKRQPGYISTQLHRGIGESSTFISHAVWESVTHFKYRPTGSSLCIST
jgi:Antibiotic biosynthesis monooxygenase